MSKDDENKTVNQEQDDEAMRQRMEQRKAARAEQKKAQQAQKEKRIATKKKISLAVTIALGVIVIMSLLFLTAQSLGNITFSRISDGIVQTFSNMKAGPGYPLSVGRNTVIRTEAYGDNLVVLEKDRLVLLNTSAKELMAYQHTFSSPRLSVSNGRILLGDSKTGRYAVLGGSGMLYEGDLQRDIYCCAVGNNGNYAFSTKSTKSASMVSFFDGKDNRKLFDFKCSDEYIIGISFSSNGKKAALIGLGTKDAVDYSKLYIISLKDKEILSEFTYEGMRLHTVFYSDPRTVVTAFNNGYSVVKNEKTRADKLLGGGSISHFAVDQSGSFAFAVNGFSDEAGSTVCAFNSKGKERFTLDLPCKVECFDYKDGRVAASGSDKKVHLISSGNEKSVRSVVPEAEAETITLIKKNVYTLGNGAIEKLKF